jgi:hypothetical protein
MIKMLRESRSEYDSVELCDDDFNHSMEISSGNRDVYSDLCEDFHSYFFNSVQLSQTKTFRESGFGPAGRDGEYDQHFSDEQNFGVGRNRMYNI